MIDWPLDWFIKHGKVVNRKNIKAFPFILQPVVEKL